MLKFIVIIFKLCLKSLHMISRFDKAMVTVIKNNSISLILMIDFSVPHINNSSHHSKHPQF